jgi:hypothetical protein
MPIAKFNEQLVTAGILPAADGVKPSSAGKRVQFDGSGCAASDRPFAATRESLAGFWPYSAY